MNDFAMQNDTPSWLTNVRELPAMRLGHRPTPSRMVTTLVPLRVIAPPSAMGLGGFAHAVKVDVRLVSFPLSGVRNDLASNQDPPPDIASTAVASLRSAELWRNNPSRLRQLPQRFLQFGQPVDFRYFTLQRLHRGSDVFEKMFVTLDQAQKSVGT